MATSQDFVNWVCSDGLDWRFLKHVLLAERDALGRYAHGTTHQTIYFPEVKAFHVALPPIDEQRAIASVLGALDDKIEGNRRLASRLHDFALSHFRHLFGARIEGPTSLAEVTEVTGGKSYKSSELAPSSTALVSLKSIAPGGGYQSGGLKSFTGSFKEQQVVQPGEIIVAMTDLTQAANVVGRAARVPNQDQFESVVASLDLAVLRPRPPISNAYLYGLLHSRAWQQQAFGYANGSTVLHLSKKAFPEFLIEVPAASEIQRLDALCDPLYATAGAAEAEADTLTAIRDALLPKLVSGKIRVPLSDDPEEQVGVDVEELSA
jgi:type I restriction enzyme S subunit